MSEPLTLPAEFDAPSQAAPEACADEVRGRERLAALRELAEIGMVLARDVKRRAADPEADPGDLGLAFARIARAVRQTLALEARLEGDLQARLRQARSRLDFDRRQAARAPYQQRARLIRRAVGQAIDADAEDEDQQEQLFEALDERLSDREDDEDFLDRPIGELVALICKDLGVSCDPALWEDEAWAQAEAAQPAQPPPDAAPAPPAPRLAPPAGVPSWLSG